MAEERVLINGRINLTVPEFFKFVLPMLTMMFGGGFIYADVQRDIEANKIEIARLVSITSAREGYISRLISLEREVVAVNERANATITAETRLMQAQFSSIIQRLERIERATGAGE